MIGTLLHFILSILSNKTYSHCQVNIPNIYKHVSAMSCGLNRLDGTMVDLQDIHVDTLRPVYILKTRYHVV